MNNVIISGREIPIKERSKSQLKGVNIGEQLSYKFFDANFHGINLLLLQPRDKMSTPRSLSILAQNIEAKFSLPVVYLLDPCPAYFRQRLIDKDVFFIISDKYAYLPMLIANERMRRKKTAKRLSPVAQYILLYHLQETSLEGMSAKDIASILPYSYSNIAFGLVCLEDLGLCKRNISSSNSKVISFPYRGKELWDKAEPYLINPVSQKTFCDELLSDKHYPICGINALARYTRLSADSECMIMMDKNEIKELMKTGSMVRQNDYDGKVSIEIWKYPPVCKEGYSSDIVDKLSLAMTLQEDNDPRVEKEVEYLISNTEWMD